MYSGIKIYTDGGSRGNPGPSAAAWILLSEEKIKEKGSSYLGIGTNNQAEYWGVILAQKWLNKNKNIIKAKEINFFLDSELVVRQLKGEYKIKDEKLKDLSGKVKQLEKSIGLTINYHSVAREKNKLADKLVNECLDSES